jgi:thioredoxin reductase (NADPH)
MEKKILPLIVIGGGPAGLSASIYACRFGIQTLLIAPLGGGLASSADYVENYPGFPQGVSGMELVNLMKEQALKFGLEMAYAQAQKVEKEGNLFRTLAEETYLSRAVIVATGAEPSKLGVPGEDKLRGRGISYCATCDGPFFKDKTVIVVGGGDSALQEALYLAQLARQVFLVHRRDQFRGAAYLVRRIEAQSNISLRLNTVINEIVGEERVQGAYLKNRITGKEEFLPAEGIFIYVGLKPNSEIVKELVKLDESGAVITDEKMKTSHEGIFACGDVRASPLRQIITACADGAIAALSAYHYLNQEK